ncbi:MAG: hypothetical protein ACREK5_00105 [Gemmatimonadota bacterium]
MSKRMIAIFCSVLVGVSLVAPNRAGAQEIPKAETPTAEECDAAVAALAGGADRKGFGWHFLPECGPAGADALAAALASAGSESGDHYLWLLTHVSGLVRSGSILDAAEGLARDAGATRAARVAGLLTLLGQYDPGLAPRFTIPWEDLISTPLTSCTMLAVPGTTDVPQYSMPENYVERIHAVMQDLSSESDPVVQTMAACMAGPAPATIDPLPSAGGRPSRHFNLTRSAQPSVHAYRAATRPLGG